MTPPPLLTHTHTHTQHSVSRKTSLPLRTHTHTHTLIFVPQCQLRPLIVDRGVVQTCSDKSSTHKHTHARKHTHTLTHTHTQAQRDSYREVIFFSGACGY